MQEIFQLSGKKFDFYLLLAVNTHQFAMIFHETHKSIFIGHEQTTDQTSVGGLICEYIDCRLDLVGDYYKVKRPSLQALAKATGVDGCHFVTVQLFLQVGEIPETIVELSLLQKCPSDCQDVIRHFHRDSLLVLSGCFE